MFGYVEVDGSSHDREVTLDRRFGGAVDTAAESGNRDGRDDPDDDDDDDQFDETERPIVSMVGKAHGSLSDQKGVVAMAGGSRFRTIVHTRLRLSAELPGAA